MTSTVGIFVLSGVLIVTVADAPDWQMRPYIGILSLGVVLALAENSQPELVRGLAGLVLIGIVIHRGERLANAINRIT